MLFGVKCWNYRLLIKYISRYFSHVLCFKLFEVFLYNYSKNFTINIKRKQKCFIIKSPILSLLKIEHIYSWNRQKTVSDLCCGCFTNIFIIYQPFPLIGYFLNTLNIILWNKHSWSYNELISEFTKHKNRSRKHKDGHYLACLIDSY